MADAETKLNVTVTATGAKETAQDLQGVAVAQGQVTGKVEAAGDATGKAAEEGKKLGASQSDVTEVLRRISPELGRFVDSLLKSSRVAGVLASENINLSDVFGKLSAAVKANAGAFQLLLAGGAAVAGFMAISAAVQALREEEERATKASKDHAAALNEVFKQRGERAAAIEEIADTRRRVGGLGAAESRRATSVAESIGAQYEQLKSGSIDYAVGMLSGLGLQREQLVQAAVLRQLGELELNARQSAESMRRTFQRSMERNRERVEEWLAREQAQGQGLGWGGERVERARVQRTGGGETIDLQALIRPFLPEGTDPARIAELMQRFGTSGALEAWERGVDPTTGRRQQLSKGNLPGGTSFWDMFRPMASVAGTDEERALVRSMLDRFASLEAALERNTAVIETRERNGPADRPAVVNHNPRYYMKQGQRTNGETRARALEGQLLGY